jgi:hypothetical protein
MGDGLIPVLEHSNQTSFIIHIYIEMNVDDEDCNYLYKMLLIILACLV